MFGHLLGALQQFELHMKTFLQLKGALEIIEYEHWNFIARQ